MESKSRIIFLILKDFHGINDTVIKKGHSVKYLKQLYLYLLL